MEDYNAYFFFILRQKIYPRTVPTGYFRSCVQVCQCASSGQTWNSDKYKEEAEQTFELVLYKYHRWVRPPQQYVNVTVELNVERIKSLDVNKQQLQTVVLLELTWFDSRLTWSPIKVHQIMSNTSTVWTPDLVFINSMPHKLVRNIQEKKEKEFCAYHIG
ncbi:acetylcholine receptor subunit alpha [Elysia marginata]|uniref:Acetylcholine receptor subunit alpha n=1 Tax=Elysia marginata TaxID=1093978 RepID=A0AAV4F4M1_9GAST|nr:acetylcholine receptor subunit alpha [Elysia marginata]